MVIVVLCYIISAENQIKDQDKSSRGTETLNIAADEAEPGDTVGKILNDSQL